MKPRILKSMPMYDRKLGARVYPWTHPIHSWVGYIYIFDDDTDDELYYFVPAEGQMGWYLHRTKAEMVTDAPHGYRLVTEPDVDTDQLVKMVRLDPA